MKSFFSSQMSKVVFVARPVIYACVILTAACIAFGYQIRTTTIFSCPAHGYSADRFLAYCQGSSYGDYEHGAFHFELEPAALDFAKNADVLFLGNSRMQFAFSAGATADWFSAVSARYYLMGFLYLENVLFAEELLRTIHPRARVLVINVDDFFDRSETAPVKTLFHDSEARNKYESKRFWQHIHEPFCTRFPALCGTKVAVFRSRETGAYYVDGAAQRQITPVSYDHTVSQKVVDSNLAVAIDLMSKFARDRCVILTVVPYVDTKIGNANAIAMGIGAKLVVPTFPEGLQTDDGVHLDRPSAERWSKAFFLKAGPLIRSCLDDRGPARPSLSIYSRVK
jgi:hypothetical protein